QLSPATPQVAGVHPQAFGIPPPPQVAGAEQLPQLTERDVPQRSNPLKSPQVAPSRMQNAESVSGAQPHTFAVPLPPHVSGEAQPPQSTVREFSQLSKSVTVPQAAPSLVQNARSVSGVQPHTF